MQMNVQFAATLYGMKLNLETGRLLSRIIRIGNGPIIYLPISQTIACVPVINWCPPMPSHWFTVSNWIAGKNRIQDMRDCVWLP